MELEIIWLTYVSRSGSTYLSQILSSSEEILVCPEADWLVSHLLEAPSENHSITRGEWREAITNDPKVKYWYFGEELIPFLMTAATNIEAFLILINKYREMVKPGATKILFKAERLVYLFPEINNALPENYHSKIIAIIRDPRAVYYSQSRTLSPENGRKLSECPGMNAIYWISHTRRSVRLSCQGKLQVIRYEDLIMETGKVIGGILKFLGASPQKLEPSSGDLFTRLPPGHRYIHNNIKSAPLPEMINQWQSGLSNHDLAIINLLTKRELKTMGYSEKPFVFSYCLYYPEILVILIKYAFLEFFTRIRFIITRNGFNPER